MLYDYPEEVLRYEIEMPSPVCEEFTLELGLREWRGTLMQFLHACIMVDRANSKLNERFRRGFTIGKNRHERKLPVAESGFSAAAIRRYGMRELVDGDMLTPDHTHIGSLNLRNRQDNSGTWHKFLVDRGRIDAVTFLAGTALVEEWNLYQRDTTILGHHNNGQSEEVLLVTADSFSMLDG